MSPSCGCAAPKLVLVGFHLEADLRHVEVSYRCSTCHAETRATYRETADPLREKT